MTSNANPPPPRGRIPPGPGDSRPDPLLIKHRRKDPLWARFSVILGAIVVISAVGVAVPRVVPSWFASGTTPTEASPDVNGPSAGWQEGDLAAEPTLTSTQEPAPADLAPYLARIPKFGPAPKPVPVALPRANGRAAFAYEIPTTQPVAFLTIDDGAIRHPLALDLIRYAKVPVTLFLTTKYVTGYQGYFQALRDTGHAVIENHTISHRQLNLLGYADQKYELCGASDLLTQWYVRRPVLFRPPYGDVNDDTLRAAWACGIQAGFYWRETVDAGNVYYQRPDHRIHAGDIILMHFRVAFPDDFIAAITAIKNSGLAPALLEDYVAADGATQPVRLPRNVI